MYCQGSRSSAETTDGSLCICFWRQVAYTDLEPDNAARFRVMLPKHCPSSVWSLPACSPPELDDEELPQSKAKSHVRDQQVCLRPRMSCCSCVLELTPVVGAQEVLWGNGLCRVELEMHGSANTNFSSSGASMPFRAALVVRAGVSLATGAWQLQVSSDLWVYNCTGIPLMVRALSRRESESEADSCSAWVAPFRVATHSSQQHEEVGRVWNYGFHARSPFAPHDGACPERPTP